jgi:hypothetical protein
MAQLDTKTPRKGLHFPPPDDEIFIELVARELRAAGARVKEVLGYVRPGYARPSYVRPKRYKGRSWSKEQVIECIQNFHKEHGRLPTTVDWRYATETNPVFSTVHRRFGSWANGIEAAGFVPKLRGWQRKNCIGCGIYIGYYREDCKTCCFRRYQRERRARLDGRS